MNAHVVSAERHASRAEYLLSAIQPELRDEGLDGVTTAIAHALLAIYHQHAAALDAFYPTTEGGT